ncbi:uncharacterized protein LOC134316665 isoform X2 [Trichomycterus rosablanca]|uniref:uncharacterized protein LOC134316665 isoform X2 n=1 Tax=Trichomycterus rosablanca TaxID=2290929 RepID=UPI002F3504BA
MSLTSVRVSMSSAMSSRIKDSSWNKSAEAVSCKVSIRPFKSAEELSCQNSTSNVKTTARLSVRQEKEEATGLMIVSRKKPQTLRPYKPPHKTKWSKEVEKVPSLQTLTRDRNSLVCSSLEYDTSHWCFSSLEADEPFKVPEPDGIMNSQQCQEGFEKIRTSTPHKKIRDSKQEFPEDQLPAFEKELHSEPVSLSFDDELVKKDVKVLTLRAASVYKGLPIVSETYPVVFTTTTTQHQHKPLKSPGFHTLSFPEQEPACKKGHMNSANIHRTKPVETLDISSPKKIKSRHPHRFYQQSGLKLNQNRGCRVSMCVLSANGMVIRFPEMGRPSFPNNDIDLKGVSSPTYKISPKFLVTPKRKHFSTSAGLVIHGKKASATFVPGRILPGYSKPVQDTQRRGLSSSEPTTTQQKQRSTGTSTAPETRTDFLKLISKLVKHSQNYVSSSITNKQIKISDAPELSKYVIENTDCGVTGVNGINLSRSASSADATSLTKETVPTGCISEYSDTSDLPISTENSLRFGSSLQQPQPIFIPTA